MNEQIIITPETEMQPPFSQPLEYGDAYFLLGFACVTVMIIWYAIAKSILNDIKPKTSKKSPTNVILHRIAQSRE